MYGESFWPEIPKELKYSEIRLPGTFRELVANDDFSNDEIGRIVRCLVMDTDFFMTGRIEPEVFYYRRILIHNMKVRNRVNACRKRRKNKPDKKLDELKNDAIQMSPDVETDCITVTDPDDGVRVARVEPLFGKTPNPIEKTPPIVPLEKKSPVPHGDSGNPIGGSREEPVRRGAPTPERQESGPEGASNRSEASVGMDVPLTREKASEAPPDADLFGVVAPDTRSDAAWIPSKFNLFWKNYPRKVAKSDASKAFTKLIKRQEDVEKFMSTLLASLDWWKRQPSWTKDGGKYIPYPATWLNSGHWEDSSESATKIGGDAEFLSVEGGTIEDLIRRLKGEENG